MIDVNSESDRLIKKLSQGVTMSRDMLADLMSLAARWKPPGYDESISKRRRYMEGNQLADLKKKLQRDFPRTFDKMGAVSVNYVKLYADQAAASYKEPPIRMITNSEEEPIEDGRADNFAGMIRSSNIDRIMLDAERIAVVAKTAFLRVGVNHASMIEGSPSVEIQPYWPCDVFVIPHPAAPHDLNLSIALMARISGPDGASGVDKWFEVWTRSIDGEMTPGGAPSAFGQWHVEHISLTTGESRTPFGSDDSIYPLSRLPWVSISDGNPMGSPYLDVNRDLTELQDNINSTWTDLMYTCRMQCHSELVYSGNSVDGDFTGGPGAILQVGANETISTLSYSPSDMQLESVDKLTQQNALVNRISPDSFNADSSNVQSGISRVIQNIPQSEARQERQQIYKLMEEKNLLPVMSQISDEWAATSIGDDVSYLVKYHEPAIYEDLQAKQTRAEMAVAAGYITKARAAVESGWYDSIEEATAAGLSDELKVAMEDDLFNLTTTDATESMRQRTQERIAAATQAVTGEE